MLEFPVEMKVQFYIRSTEGACFHVLSMREALDHLKSDEGYRLTITDEQGNEIVIRCGDFIPAITPESVVCDEATITIRTKETPDAS